MDFLLSTLVLIGAGAFYYFVLYSKPQDDDWHKLPSLSEYLAKHPECKTEDPESAKCYSCGSDKVIFQPLTSHEDPRYKHICLSCKKILFKSKAIMS
ncbi:hypothetical protein [Photobacterium lutimaris]|uniref:Uncharacterized protein n=1 Tax=Photobacterium lutimaris TaxID=388278 RepID=A0A2T3J1G7_9GAMM|nr:hypothetical protein [Photobacterium lutimaris]PSU34918.1 hypothetical protein C9I99_07545 [Photobacterium lutimaris]TDR77267.1 hypothetical protein DFP78_102284 [Photobacterium lutimaris]